MTNLAIGRIDKRLTKEKEYWLSKLSGPLKVTGIPLDFPRPAEYSRQKAAFDFAIAGETQKKLQRLCQNRESLTFTVLLAALKICLLKYEGEEDIIVGTSIQARHSDLASLNKVLPLRSRVVPLMTVRELFEQLRLTLHEAYAHQKFPFERTLQLLDIRETENRAPLFNVVAIIDTAESRGLVSHLKNDLTLAVSIADGDWRLALQYNPLLFQSHTVKTFASHYLRVLDAAVSATGARLSDLEFLSEDQRQSLLVDYNATERDYSKQRTIHALFEEQVTRTPDTLAIRCENHHVTFRELNSRANQLAQHLLKAGATTGSLIGVYLEHSVEVVVAILGTLKVGAGYVPLEMAHPIKRVAQMMADAQVSLVLTRQRFAARLAGHAVKAVCLDADWPSVSRESDADLKGCAVAEGIAYVIYTSGSTGKPKGVAISHRALVNYLSWAREVYLKGDSLGFSLYSSLVFDLTVTSLFTPLITANPLTVYPHERHETPLEAMLSDDRVGILKLTPSHAALIKGRDNRQSGIKRLIFGGESLGAKLAKEVFDSFGGQTEIFNEYGPTETTVGCMIHQYDPAKQVRQVVAIGKPAMNMNVYALDGELSPVAENIIGEIYIGGDGLALGYYGQPEVTAERFIPHPFAHGERLYRTGDLAKWVEGRDLEYIGRADEQVKYHGYRVELNEVRCAMNEHPKITDSVIVVQSDDQGFDVMVAYYVARQPLKTTALRAFLADRLIGETIPNLFAHLKKIPLTLNGKVNYDALPTLAKGRTNLKQLYEAPRTPTEEMLAGIWAEVLHIDRVSAHHDFFELGGHSLIATQVISRIRDAFKVEIPLRALFDWPTIRQLAGMIEKEIGLGKRTPGPPIRPVGRAREFPLSFGQQRLWFIQQLEPDNPAYNIPYAARLKGALNLPAFKESLRRMVARHGSLRTRFEMRAGQPMQIVDPPAPIEITEWDLSKDPEPERQRRARAIIDRDAMRPFDLQRGPVWRASLVCLKEDEFILFLCIHHIASDGWSTGVLVRELTLLYESLRSGLEPDLPPLPAQYTDFAVWQRAWMQGEMLQQQLDYWKRQLAGLLKLELPGDRPRPTVASHRGARFPFSLSDDLSRRLQSLSRRQGVTLFMTLLAGFQILLSRYSRQDDIATGIPISGRNRPEIEGLIGFFVNTLVMRLDLGGNPTVLEALSRAREMALDAYAHQDLPFEKLVEEMHPERSLSHEPLFQVMLIFQSEPDRIVSDLVVSDETVRLDTAKFDLTISFGEEQGKINGSLEYATELFDESRARRLEQHLRRLFEGMCDAPDARVKDLPMMSDAECRQILVEWNRTAASYPLEKCVDDLFERQVRERGEAIAVVFEQEQVTYEELNRRANRLAHRLRETGVGADVAVALYLDRNLEMATALLGVMKAGGAYVPLDPWYPAERLKFMLEDARPLIVLTQTGLSERLPTDSLPVICLDANRQSLQSCDEENPPAEVWPESLAYVIYTSGSTGNPKGVCISRRALINFISCMKRQLEFTEESVLLAVTSLSFDISMLEIFLPLVSGGRLVLATREAAADGHLLGQLLAESAASHMQATPATWRTLLDCGWAGGAGLCVLCGGEALRRELAEGLFAKSAKLWNLYGPTETTIWSSASLLDGGAAIPIGRPLANTDLYILDDRLQPVPVGVRGELFIGGDGVARGYLNRADLTAERFMPNGFRGEGERVYRTGDLTWYQESGNIEYVERLDNQVKLRGHRLELGEVETALLQHPAVRQCVAVVREDEPGDRRLVAYVVAGNDRAQQMPVAPTQNQLDQWQAIWDEAYAGSPADVDMLFNTTGWNSSYTGRPMTDEEMREWLDGTVGRIAALNPRRVLEIGCGTGMVLFALVASCDEYWATDISSVALDSVRNGLQGFGDGAARVTLLKQAADDFTGIAVGRFDAVILNSVAQYFPNADYLKRVIKNAIDAVSPGGCVFLGDIRNLRLLEALHASIQLRRAPEHQSVKELSKRVRRQLTMEKELLIAPGFFVALKREISDISMVRIELKRGRTHNELTRFRYDVTLHVGKPPAVEAEIASMDWETSGLTIDELRRRLVAEKLRALCISGVPNARLSEETSLLNLLARQDDHLTVAELKARLEERGTGADVDPQDLWEIGEELGYEVEVCWSGADESRSFDVLFRQKGAALQSPPLAERSLTRAQSLQEKSGEFTNDPALSLLLSGLAPELRAYLKGKLPEYMLPSAFIILSQLPLTPNGKLNRKALPAPMTSGGAEEGRAPRTPIEEILASIWQSVLRADSIGMADNFFDLGGHSLLATQVISRVRELLKVELPLRVLFEKPTVAGLAEAVTSQRRPAATLVALPIRAVSRDEELPLSFAQQRLWFIHQLEPASWAYNLPFIVRLLGAFDIPVIEQSLNEIARRHESLRTRFAVRNGQPLQFIDEPRHMSLRIYDLEITQAEAEALAQQLANQEVRRPFDLQCDPMWRAAAIRLSPEDHVLVVTMHHIASDGWSKSILVKEFSTLYESYKAGARSNLAKLTIQYADFAMWQKNWLRGEVYEQLRGYWAKQLAGAQTRLDLPVTRARFASSRFRGARQEAQFPHALRQDLTALSRREGATLFMTLLAAFKALLYLYTSQEDIVVGTNIANRERMETEGLIGFFVNNLVLRTSLAANPTFRELLGRVREVCLAAYDHQNMPFEKLVEELKPERGLGHDTLFQVLFVLQNNAALDFKLPSLRLGRIEVEDEASGLDLLLNMWETRSGLVASARYNTDLFDHSTISQMLTQFRTLLEQVVANPDQRINSFSLTKEDRRPLISSFNDELADDDSSPSSVENETMLA